MTKQKTDLQVFQEWVQELTGFVFGTKEKSKPKKRKRARKKDGTYNQVSQFNRNTYTNSLFDKLGFKIEQLLPIFGNQNNVFNRGTHNRYIDNNKLAVSKLNNMVKPVTTNGFISATLNQSLNTSNLNYLFGNLDGNNQLEKSVSQTLHLIGFFFS